MNAHWPSIRYKMSILCIRDVLVSDHPVGLSERMDFKNSSVISESPNFMDLGLSPANTTVKLKSVIRPTTRVEGLTDGSDFLASRHGCGEVTVVKVSKTKAFSGYIKKLEFETMKAFGGKIFL